MQTGARGTPGTCRLIGMNRLRGVAALSILTTHVWDYGTPNGRPPAPRDSHSLENRIGAR
jgi:peptidoglycan/LPS O-acetylase OafA/YrhL